KLAFYTGARNCEWMGLQWRDVDWETGKLTIQRSLKRRREKGRYNEFYTEPPKRENGLRGIALTPDNIQGQRARGEAQKEEQMAARAEWSNPSDFIFTDPKGNPLKMEAVRLLHKQILADAELPSTFKLKSSRHTSATALIKTTDLKTVSARLGHADVETTINFYVQDTDERQEEASKQMEKWLGTGTE